MEHLRANGFQVEAHNVDDAKLMALEREAGLPRNLTSCHTAKVEGYVLEGHVPAADVRRLLREKPAVAGLTVPGMPMGSPGMEAGGARQPYSVLTFSKDGRSSVFASYK
jgi:hypothetical protein